MSELCLSTNSFSTKTPFSSLLISDLKQFCSFIISHPLYFSYLLFFSPYLLKILSFLFPLVFTTSLLLLAFLTVSPGLIFHRHFSPESKVSDLLSACRAVVQSFTSKIEDFGQEEYFDLEDFEAYKIVFEGSIIEVQENRAEFSEQSLAEAENGFAATEQYLLENQKEVSEVPEEANVNKTETAIDSKYMKVESCRTLDCSGSMRKEKEWKRTLACKLYEERHSGGDGSGEGMDLLWETYEMEAIKNKAKREESKKKKKKGVEMKKRYNNDSDEEEMGDQLCCLQALKFSAGKVNLGMGKPSLVKISKAIKGFGWLHHVSKHSKKVHIEDRL